jgi:hypothetical protein
MSRIGVLVLVVMTAALPAAVALAAQSPRAVRASILDAAKAQQSVHYVAVQIAGNSQLILTGDVAATDGRQQVSFKAGKEKGHMTILVFDQTAYAQGDSSGLQLLLGLSHAQASTYAGQWISIPKADKHYSSAAASVPSVRSCSPSLLRGGSLPPSARLRAGE